MAKTSSKLLKPVGSRPGVIYGLCRVYESIMDNYMFISTNFISFEHSYLQKFLKFLVPVLKPFIVFEFRVNPLKSMNNNLISS